LEQKDDLLAGRTPRPKTEGLALWDLANRYLADKKHHGCLDRELLRQHPVVEVVGPVGSETTGPLTFMLPAVKL